MLPVLVKRELQDTLKKQRALWFLLVGLLLFVLNVFVGVDAYRKAHDWYVAEAGQPLRPAFYDSSYTMSDVLDRYIIYREPAALMFISGGNEKFLPREVWVQPGGVVRPRPIDIYTKLLPNIPPIDWVFIVTIVFSLFVLILTFDSVSGEKESGTLAIVFSNSVSRLGYLASKYVAIMVISTLAMGLGMLVSLIRVGWLLPDMYEPETIARILVFFCATELYLSIFALLGLAVSAKMSRSSMVLFTLIMIWSGLFVVPDVTRELPYMLGTPSSQRELKENIDAIHYEDRNYILQQRINNGEFSSAEDVSTAGYELEFNMQYRTNRLVDAYYQELDEYQNRARMSARISPMSLFKNAAEAITATGTVRYRRFLDSLRSYSAVYDAYFIQKTGRLTPTIEYGVQTVVDFNGTIIRQWWMPNYADVDISDFPVFTFTPPTLAESITDGAIDLAGLALWNIVLAVAVCVAFLRMDARKVY